MDEKNFVTPQPPVGLPMVDSSKNFGQGAVGQMPPEPEDILESIDQSDVDVQKTPTRPALAAAMPPRALSGANLPPSLPPMPRSVSKEPMFNRGRRAMVVVVLVLVLLVIIGAAAWYGYSVFFSSAKTLSGSTNQPSVNTPSPVTTTPVQPSPETVPEPEPTITTEPATSPDTTVAKPLDTDQDGLTDEEEKLYGTNASSPDSDNDGLTDRDEVKIFKTDPNTADTDGDGFTDGQEVRSGYDPKGPGKLLEVQGNL